MPARSSPRPSTWAWRGIQRAWFLCWWGDVGSCNTDLCCCSFFVLQGRHCHKYILNTTPTHAYIHTQSMCIFWREGVRTCTHVHHLECNYVYKLETNFRPWVKFRNKVLDGHSLLAFRVNDLCIKKRISYL